MAGGRKRKSCAKKKKSRADYRCDPCTILLASTKWSEALALLMLVDIDLSIVKIDDFELNH